VLDVVDGEAVFADAAADCGTKLGDCDSSCPPDEAGLGGVVEAGVCSATGDEEGFADSCAFAFSMSSKEIAITQCQIRITHLDFAFCPSASTSKRSASVAVVLVVVITRRLLA